MLTSVLKLINISIEYNEAFSAALSTASSGGSPVEIARVFSEKTGTQLDDQAVDALVKLIENVQSRLPEIDDSKDALLEAIKTYWPPIRSKAQTFLSAAEDGLPAAIDMGRFILQQIDERVHDIEGILAAADIALELIEEQLKDFVTEEPEREE